MDQETRQRENTASKTPPLPPTRLPNEDYYRNPQATGMSRSRQLGLALILAGVMWLSLQILSGNLFFGGSQDIELIDKTLSGDRIEVDVGTADVEVQVWDNDGIRVEAFQHGGSASKDSIEIRQDGSTVIVKQPLTFNFFFWDDNNVSYRISVPHATDAEIHTLSGDIKLEGIMADVQINTTSGNVQLHNIDGRLEVTTISGEVELEEGQFSDANVATTSGDIVMEEVSGPLTLKSISGNISVEDASNSSFNVSLTSGNFDYSGDLEDVNLVETISGNVMILLPSDSSFTLEANTVSGWIENDFDLGDIEEGSRSIRGVVGTGDTKLNINTTSGNVQVEQR